MRFDLDATLALLERTPSVLDTLLRDLPDDWIRATEGPETWSPFDVVGHLIHGERTDWMTRARLILRPGGPQCWNSLHGNGVLTDEAGVD